MSEESGTKEDAVAKLRHDMRTPINHILGYSELIEEELNEETRAELGGDLKKISTAARTLLDLISSNISREQLTSLLSGGESVTALQKSVSAVSATPFKEHSEMEVAIKGHILVVDDNEENREVLARRLERQGHTVQRAHDGLNALEKLRDGKFDLVLLDVMMPGLDGYGVLSEMKSDAALRHIPVIMISALDEIESVVRCIESGAEDYLPKPFNPTLLRARIGASLEKKNLRDLEQQHLHLIEQTQLRLSEELNEAGKYVRSILPEPEKSPFQITWRYIPSTELGGDSFGYHWLDEDHFAIYLLDVCGHGVGAALLSVSAINVLRAGSLPDTDFHDPGAVLSALNETFPMEKQNNMYFTIWYGVYHKPTRTMRHASGGHPDALLLKPAGEGYDLEGLRSPGLVIGVMPGMEFSSATSEVPPGSQLIILSDGTYELKNTNGEMIGFEEFQEIVKSRAPAHNLLDDMLEWARDLQGEGPFDDDFSMVSIEFPKD